MREPWPIHQRNNLSRPAELGNMYLEDMLVPYMHYRGLVDQGLATMHVDEESDRVRIVDANGSTLIDTDNYAILEIHYKRSQEQRDEDMLYGSGGEPSH